ncbi:MAG: hypothetical protein ACOCUS_03715 [Polyangiales bacterium]
MPKYECLQSVVLGNKLRRARTIIDITVEVARTLNAKREQVREVLDAREDDAPSDPDERHRLLVEHIAGMTVPEDPKADEAWTNGGKPDAGALAKALGWGSVSAKERDAAWEEVVEQRDGDGNSD